MFRGYVTIVYRKWLNSWKFKTCNWNRPWFSVLIFSEHYAKLCTPNQNKRKHSPIIWEFVYLVLQSFILFFFLLSINPFFHCQQLHQAVLSISKFMAYPWQIMAMYKLWLQTHFKVTLRILHNNLVLFHSLQIVLDTRVFRGTIYNHLLQWMKNKPETNLLL